MGVLNQSLMVLFLISRCEVFVGSCLVFPGVSMGCYADSPTRDLPLFWMTSNNLTLTSCANYCFEKVQFSDQFGERFTFGSKYFAQLYIRCSDFYEGGMHWLTKYIRQLSEVPGQICRRQVLFSGTKYVQRRKKTTALV